MVSPEEKALEWERTRTKARAQAGRIYDVLVDLCGAPEDEYQRDAFIYHFPTPEYRFMGSLGFGGKFWVDGGGWRVNCYREDETPARLEIIDEANRLLKLLWEEVYNGVL